MTFHSMAANAYHHLILKHPYPTLGATLKIRCQGHTIEIQELAARTDEQRRFKVRISDGRFSTYNGTLAIVPDGMSISEDM